jgi:hypothetical protein
MSQGIFGVIDFKGGIDSPDDLSFTMGTFLRKDGSQKRENILIEIGWYQILQ